MKRTQGGSNGLTLVALNAEKKTGNQTRGCERAGAGINGTLLAWFERPTRGSARAEVAKSATLGLNDANGRKEPKQNP